MPKIYQPEEVCNGCLMSKQTRKQFPSKASNNIIKVLQLIHEDLCGPFLLKTASGPERKVRVVITDRSGEFGSNEFKKFYKKDGLIRHYTAPYMPQQNGVMERRNRTVVEMAKICLKEMKLPSFMWGEVIRHSVYLLNKLPMRALSKSLVNLGKEPGTKAYCLYDPSSNKVFVIRDVIFEENNSWSWETNDVSEASMFIIDAESPILQSPVQQLNPENYDDSSELNRIINLSEIYNETEEQQLDEELYLMGIEEPMNFVQAAKDINWKLAMKKEMQSIEENQNWKLSELPPGKKVVISGIYRVIILLLNNYYVSSVSILYRFLVLCSLILEVMVVGGCRRFVVRPYNGQVRPMCALDPVVRAVPCALLGSRKNQLVPRIPSPARELGVQVDRAKLVGARVCESQTSDPGLEGATKVIGLKWIFKLKKDGEGRIVKHKARFVPKGYVQERVVDFDEVFAPVTRPEMVHFLLALAAKNELEVHHLDVPKTKYGSIGWLVGATLGYAQAAKDKRIIACIGDGSFQVTAQDVSTMLRCGQNQIIFLITVVIPLKLRSMMNHTM
ncbi:hypothetical protein AgCh_025583 [Apium graveolens]